MSSGTSSTIKPNHRPTVIRDVRVFDGTRMLQGMTVVIRNGLIEQVTPAAAHDGHAEIVDGAGRTLLPGLIDAHTHVFPGGLAQALRFGVTTEFDMFSTDRTSADSKEQARTRDDVADIRSAGVGATAPNGHPSQIMGPVFGPFPTVAGPDDAEAFVHARLADGSNYLKILIEDGAQLGMDIPALDRPTVRALVAAAHAAGMKTIAHAISLDSAELAIDAGVDGLAHMYVSPSTDQDVVERSSTRIAKAAAAAGVFVIGTLALVEAMTGSDAGVELAADPRIGPYLPDSVRPAVGKPMPMMPPMPHIYRNAKRASAALYEAGVPLLAGTDANDGPHGSFPVVHGASVHRELVCLVDAGLSPVEALAAATSSPAAHFGLTDRGRIAPGLRADLVLVDGDPAADITATRSIVAIWRAGVPVAGVDRNASVQGVVAELAEPALQPNQ
jgi:imidazolonepropionase-like amidohydrolase